MAPEIVSCVQTELLSASYDNIILKAKQVYCLERFYLKKKRFARRPANRLRKIFSLPSFTVINVVSSPSLPWSA